MYISIPNFLVAAVHVYVKRPNLLFFYNQEDSQKHISLIADSFKMIDGPVQIQIVHTFLASF